MTVSYPMAMFMMCAYLCGFALPPLYRGWNDTREGNPQCTEKTLSQCYVVYHKFHMAWPCNEHGPLLLRFRQLNAWAVIRT